MAKIFMFLFAISISFINFTQNSKSIMKSINEVPIQELKAIGNMG